MYTPATVIITGPTATGKTELSLGLARHFNAPVISADARQCYKYLDIGTAKVSEAIRAETPHYHVSSLSPDEPFTAADFSQKARQWSDEISQKGKPVIIAGGSTLYLESLIRPFDPLPPKNEANLRELEAISEKHGLEEIRKRLQEADPAYLERIDGLNRHRMFRALDVWMQTGKPFSSFHQNKPFSLPDNTLLICLNRNRDELHERINRRVDKMLELGLIREVEQILDKGYHPELQSLQTVGYREVISHLRGELSAERMREKIKTHTRQYARRQITWFRRWGPARWIDQSAQPETKLLENILQMFEQLEAEAER